MSSITVTGKDTLVMTYMSSTPELPRTYLLLKAYQREHQTFQQVTPEKTILNDSFELSSLRHAPQYYTFRVGGYQRHIEDLIIQATADSTNIELFAKQHAVHNSEEGTFARLVRQNDQPQPPVLPFNNTSTRVADGGNVPWQEDNGQDQCIANDPVIGIALDLPAKEVAQPPIPPYKSAQSSTPESVSAAVGMAEEESGFRGITEPAVVTLSKSGILRYQYFFHREANDHRRLCPQLTSFKSGSTGPSKTGDEECKSSSGATAATATPSSKPVLAPTSASMGKSPDGSQKQKNKRCAHEIEAHGADADLEEQRASFRRRTSNAWTESDLDADCEVSDSNSETTNPHHQLRKKLKRSIAASYDVNEPGSPPLISRQPLPGSLATQPTMNESSHIAADSTQTSLCTSHHPESDAFSASVFSITPVIRAHDHDFSGAGAPTPEAPEAPSLPAKETRFPTTKQNYLTPSSFNAAYETDKQQFSFSFLEENDAPEYPWSSQNEEFSRPQTRSTVSKAEPEKDWLSVCSATNKFATRTNNVSPTILKESSTSIERQAPEGEDLVPSIHCVSQDDWKFLQASKQRLEQYRLRATLKDGKTNEFPGLHAVRANPEDTNEVNEQAASSVSRVATYTFKSHWETQENTNPLLPESPQLSYESSIGKGKNKRMAVLPFRPQKRHANVSNMNVASFRETSPAGPDRTIPNERHATVQVIDTAGQEGFTGLARSEDNMTGGEAALGENDEDGANGNTNDGSVSSRTSLDVSQFEKADHAPGAAEPLSDQLSGYSFSFASQAKEENSDATESAIDATDAKTIRTKTSATGWSPFKNQEDNGHGEVLSEQSVPYLPL